MRGVVLPDDHRRSGRRVQAALDADLAADTLLGGGDTSDVEGD
jgi:hypothetical protein